MSIALAVEKHSGTGPPLGAGADTLPREPELSAKSSSEGVISADLAAEVQKQMARMGQGSAERAALLGVLLARFIDVPFEDVSDLLKIKPGRLLKMLHGRETIPGGVSKRWESIAEIAFNVQTVLDPAAMSKWLDTAIPDLDGRSPRLAIKKGDVEKVLKITRSYRDPNFS